MKKILLLLALLLSHSLTSFAQVSAAAYDKEDMATFGKTKTLFVLSANRKLNNEVIAGLKQYWKHTAWDTIPEADMDKYVANSAYSFMMVIQIQVITQTKDQYGKVLRTTTDYYHYFGVVNGGKKGIQHFVYNDMIAYCPINFKMDETPMYMCGYRGQSMVYNLQAAITMVKEKQLDGNSYRMVKDMQEIYNKEAPAIKTKTLLVNKEHLIDITEAEFRDNYPFKVEFVSKEEFQKAYASKDKKYVLFQPTVTMQKSIFVFDAETYKCLYFGTDNLRLKLKEGDIKDMAKAIGKK